MRKRFHHTLIALACCAGLSTGALAQTASSREADLAARLDRLASELEAVKAQLAELKKAQPAPAPLAAATPDAASANLANGDSAASPSAPATVLTSYGEINFNHYNRQSSADTADVRRFVLGFQHRFDAKTKVVTELEVEHTIASADDSGEVEVEQAYAERQLSDTLALRAGLFLMPVGLLNENHEPTAYYGVERNFVETAIIPSTWREGGVQLVANLDHGLTVQGGLSTGFNINNWDAANSETAESPLGAIHQELSQARSHDLAVFGALNWRGVPGLQLGGSLFTGNAGQAATTTGQMRVTLWDLHARYTPGSWDLSALYARGTISNTAGFNTLSVGNDYLVPKRFDGAYVQVANKVWSHEDYSLAPFVRLERFNTRAAYADIGQGLTPEAAPAETVWTLGANFKVGDGLVFKADFQRFKQNRDSDRFDLGMGWSF
jgi:hypothetical protein